VFDPDTDRAAPERLWGLYDRVPVLEESHDAAIARDPGFAFQSSGAKTLIQIDKLHGRIDWNPSPPSGTGRRGQGGVNP